MQELNNIFTPADILLPAEADMTAWSVIACDQYTSQPEYWQKVMQTVGSRPSTLSLFMPEAFLEDPNRRTTEQINESQNRLLCSNFFNKYSNSMIYIERTLRDGRIRRGIVGAVDLEQYSYESECHLPVRATEQTVCDRLPPRVKIRSNAPLELPHIMLLVDDPELEVIEPIAAQKDSLKKVYDFELMQESGHICGYLITGELATAVSNTVESLGNPHRQLRMYGDTTANMVLAVGDGNHSLAAAKQCWEHIKQTLSESEQANHPARYALCEIVNLHDPALEFEPIHRVLFSCDAEKVKAAIKVVFPSVVEGCCDGQSFGFITSNGRIDFSIPEPSQPLAVGSVQAFLDDYVAAKGGRVDYIHGADVLYSLCSGGDACGFILPAIEKSELFAAVIKGGSLPRKTFSMGEACDKRFYVEARRLF